MSWKINGRWEIIDYYVFKMFSYISLRETGQTEEKDWGTLVGGYQLDHINKLLGRNN